MPTGTLKKFFAEKGFGFIAPDDGTQDFFAHKRALLGGNEDSIREGAKVSYMAEVEERTGKPKATTWTILDGGAAGAAQMAGAAGLMGMMAGAVPDYGALAAASFGAVQAAGAHMSPYGALGGLTMPTGMPMAMGLPLGWEQVADPSTGNAYYCNRATGESSWTPPVAAAAPVAAMAPVPVAAAPGGLPAGWESANDPSSGKPYYFNRATGETKWEIPVA